MRQWSNIEGAASLVSIPTSGISALLDSIHSRVDALVQKPLLHSGTSLDGRGSVVRSEETNLGNMLANAVRAFYDTDIAFFNSGSIRCDQVLGPTIPNGSPLLVKDIISRSCSLQNSGKEQRTSADEQTSVHSRTLCWSKESAVESYCTPWKTQSAICIWTDASSR